MDILSWVDTGACKTQDSDAQSGKIQISRTHMLNPPIHSRPTALGVLIPSLHTYKNAQNKRISKDYFTFSDSLLPNLLKTALNENP